MKVFLLSCSGLAPLYANIQEQLDTKDRQAYRLVAYELARYLSCTVEELGEGAKGRSGNSGKEGDGGDEVGSRSVVGHLKLSEDAPS